LSHWGLKLSRSSGVAKPKLDCERDNNVYFTQDKSDKIIKYILPHFQRSNRVLNCLDACCGLGVLGKSLEKNKLCRVTYIDNRDMPIDNFIRADLSTKKLKCQYDIITCNPPWIPTQYTYQIYNNLCKSLKYNGVLVFICNNTFFYQSSKRAVNLKFNKYYDLPRDTFKESGKLMLDCRVGIYHNDDLVPAPAANLHTFIDLRTEDCSTKNLF